MGMYSSDGKYNTDYDSNEEEDDPEYYDSSSDESGKSANHQSTSEEEDVFSLSLETQIPLESMTFFQVGKSMGISITHLVIYGGFSIPGPAFPLLPNYRLSSNSHRCSHTNKKNNWQIQRNKL